MCSDIINLTRKEEYLIILNIRLKKETRHNIKEHGDRNTDMDLTMYLGIEKS